MERNQCAAGWLSPQTAVIQEKLSREARGANQSGSQALVSITLTVRGSNEDEDYSGGGGGGGGGPPAESQSEAPD